jgi:CRP-like cAMP-binding protein
MRKIKLGHYPTPTVLNEIGQPIKFAFFVNDGLASVLSIMADGKSVEVGLCGKEGFVGIPLTVGFRTSHTRTIVQVAGSAFRMSAKDLVAALRDCPKLMAGIQQFAQELNLQSSQVAACNRLHEVEERLARWLLMPQDRLGGDLVPLTQEHDYILDESTPVCDNLPMVSNAHFLLGLAADAVAWSIFRISFLIEASNFLVGTFSNNFFLPLSIRGVL